MHLITRQIVQVGDIDPLRCIYQNNTNISVGVIGASGGGVVLFVIIAISVAVAVLAR